jgi:hypothetical protein
LRVSVVHFTPADDRMVRTGLIGWASFLLDEQIRVSGIAVRQTRGGRRTLSYPARDDGWGLRWPLVQPITDEARASIERQVLEQLGEVA